MQQTAGKDLKDVAPGDSPRLVIRDLQVEFGATVALNKVNIEISAGEIVGLLGHNGAGKSTVVNVVSGAIRPTSGSVFIDGRELPLSRSTPRQMADQGIKVIHQDPALAPGLSIADNIMLETRGENLRRPERIRRARLALARVGSTLDPHLTVDLLDLGSRQVVDIARAMSGDVKVMFLDEPTGALGKEETEHLHSLIREVAASGCAVIYVSHRMRDVAEICSRIVVLREGNVVLDRASAGLTASSLGEALAPIGNDTSSQAVGSGKIRYRDALSAGAAKSIIWRGQELAVYPGEITGFYGMAGGPQYALFESIFGLTEVPTIISLDDVSTPAASPPDAISRGIYLVTADRERDALIPEATGLVNMTLPWLSRMVKGLGVSRRQMVGVYENARSGLKIFGAPMTAAIESFSGGNRQKHVLGRWFYGSLRPRVLLLEQPTQGVDVQARRDIAVALRDMAENGVVVMVASSETDEVAQLCDRAYICVGAKWKLIDRHEGWQDTLLVELLNDEE